MIFPVGLLWFSQEQFPWILTEAGILFLLVLLFRTALQKTVPGRSMAAHYGKTARALPDSPPAPYISCRDVSHHCGTEDWVNSSDIAPGFTAEELKAVRMDPLYHFDSLLSPLINGNRLPKAG